MAIDKIQSESINLADNFAFTGTVTGAGITGLSVTDHFRFNNTLSVSANTATTISTFNGTSDVSTGTSFTHSSGIFTPPQTGIYFVIGNFACYRTSGTFIPYISTEVQVSVNSGSSYSKKAQSQNFVGQDGSGNRWHQTYTSAIVDITNTTTDRIRFSCNATESFSIENGATSYCEFIKLAET